jgi:ABC-2 type transport system permease protein
VARHEYLSNIRRREFILITLGFPLMLLALGGISALGTMAAAGSMLSPKGMSIGLVDRSSSLRFGEVQRRAGLTPIPFPTTEAALAALRAGTVSSVLVAEADYMETGRTTVYRARSGLLQAEDRTPYGRILIEALITADRAAPAVRDRLIAPTGNGPAQLVLNTKTGKFEPQNPAALVAKFAVPYAFTLLLTTSIFIAGNYLLRGVSEEKENRVIEVMLSSISADDLLLGKLIGLAGVGLTQVCAWVFMGAVPSALMWSSVVRLNPIAVLGAVVFFALGFALYAAMMAGVGALGASYRESQQISGVVSLLAVIPLMVLPVLLEFPNGTAARILSYIPFTAPGTMVLRLTAHDVPALDTAMSALLLLVTIVIVIRLSARLFRFGMLITGKRPGLRETVAALRRA